MSPSAVSPFLPPALALATVLLGTAAVAQPSPLQRATPRTVLVTGQTGESHDVRVAPGFLTTIRLDAPLVREAIEVEGRARFTLDAGDQTLSVEPLAPLGPHESRILRVPYQAGSPAFAVLRLLAATDEVDTVITVIRPQPSAETCLPALTAAQERSEAQSREVEQLKAQLPAASPAALGLAGLVDKEGVKVQQHWAHVTGPGRLEPEGLTLMRASQWAVVILHGVRNAGQELWAPEWAEFTPTAGGPPRRARALLPLQVAIAPRESVSMAVEVEMPLRDRTKWLRESYTLALCDAAGRCLTLQDVPL